MARSDAVRTHEEGFLQQGVPLDMAVADHAGIGRAAPQVFLRKIGNDSFLKFRPEVKYMMGNVQHAAYRRGVLRRVPAPALVLLRPKAPGILPEKHGGADDFIARFL